MVIGSSKVQDAQPMQRAGDDEPQQCAINVVPTGETAQKGFGSFFSDEPGIVITGWALKIRAALAHASNESRQAPPGVLGQLRQHFQDSLAGEQRLIHPFAFKFETRQEKQIVKVSLCSQERARSARASARPASRKERTVSGSGSPLAIDQSCARSSSLSCSRCDRTGRGAQLCRFRHSCAVQPASVQAWSRMRSDAIA
jgi:hypothetical protein